MRLYRLTKSRYATAEKAFSGMGVTREPGRWTRRESDIRAVYCSESLALACLETLVHIRPAPRRFPQTVFFTIDIPDRHLERLQPQALPRSWNATIAADATRNMGTAFLREERAVALLVPTAIVPIGFNAIVNPRHPEFRLEWVQGPHRFVYGGRLA